jgi:hypothetical protein
MATTSADVITPVRGEPGGGSAMRLEYILVGIADRIRLA